jgi:cytochrome P450
MNCRSHHDRPIQIKRDPSLTKRITRYADARAALTHPELSRHPSLRKTTEPMERHVLNATGDDHVRQRRVISEMVDRRTGLILPGVRDVVETWLDRVSTTSAADMANGFVYPVALSVVDDLLELTGGDQAAQQWWRQVAFEVDSGRIAAALLEEIRVRARARTGQLVAAMTVTGLQLDPAEQAANILFAFLAGFTNLANVLGNALLALAHHPDQYRWLADDPVTRAAGATEELLRFAEPDSRSSMRVAAHNVDIGATHIAAGETVRICRGTANRDPSRFPDPGRLDLARSAGGQLTLGFGPHYCPASALTRHVLECMLLGLVRRFSALYSELGKWDIQGAAPLPMVLTRHTATPS